MNFSKFEKQIEKAGYKVHNDQVIGAAGDVVALVDGHGEVHSKDGDFLELLVNLVYEDEVVVVEEKPLFKAEKVVAKAKAKKAKK